ncbi:MAG: GNAT family N-acetyltransferase [Proteobacteria bacterium]|nr:GNAT family N-acetyltransferase [Pseudomonadota bacterium]
MLLKKQRKKVNDNWDGTISILGEVPSARIPRRNGEIVGGVNGSIIFRSIYTAQLWVDPAYRKQGLGLRLMQKVLELGLEKGCTMATLCTMDFQEAKSFYEKLGYQ